MSGISQYRNVFNEVATTANLSHIFDLVNVNNDDRIQFREFQKQVENVGLKIDRTECRKSYDEIAKSSNEKSVTKYAWMNGINNASPEVAKIYRAILIGGQYDYQSGRSEMHLDDIAKAIVNTKAEWKLRISAMESLSRQITSPKLAVDRFHSMLRTFHDGLLKQCKERRSQVMRVACETFGKILLKWKRDFIRYAPKTIEHLYELIRQKIEIVKNSASAVVLTLIKVCPDKSRCKILDILGKEGTTSKFQHLKTEIFRFLIVYFVHQSPTLKNETKFWNILMGYTQKGVKDSVVQTRDNALWLLSAIERERPDLVKPIVKSMNDHVRKRYATDFHGQMSEYAKVASSDYYASAATAAAPRTSKKKKGKKSKKSNTNRNEWSAANAASSINTFGDDYDVKNDGVCILPTNKNTSLSQSNGGNGKIPSDHLRKHTWSTNDLLVGFQKMQKKVEYKKQKKHKSRKNKTKISSKEKRFPSPPTDIYWNAFGEPLEEHDIQYAFNMIDYQKNRKVGIKEFIIILKKLDLENVKNSMSADTLFSHFNINGNGNNAQISYYDFKHALDGKSPELNEFWQRLLYCTMLHFPPLIPDLNSEQSTKLLTNVSASEEHRIHAIHSISRKMCLKMDTKKFIKIFRRVIGMFCTQLKDFRHPFVMRETCIALAKIMTGKRAQFLKFAPRLLDTLYECIHVQKPEILHLSAHQCARTMVRFVPDSKHFPLFARITDGVCDTKFVRVRTSSYEFVNRILTTMVIADQSRTDKFWNLMEICLKSGINDGDQHVRHQSYVALAKIEILNIDLNVKYVHQLRKIAKDKYDVVYRNVMQDMSNQDFGSASFKNPGVILSTKTEEEWGETYPVRLTKKGSRSSLLSIETGTPPSSSGSPSVRAARRGPSDTVSPYGITIDSRFTNSLIVAAQLYRERQSQQVKGVKHKHTKNKHNTKHNKRKSVHKHRSKHSNASTLSSISSQSERRHKSSKKRNSSPSFLSQSHSDSNNFNNVSSALSIIADDNNNVYLATAEAENNRRSSKKKPKTPRKKAKDDEDITPKNSVRRCTNISKEELLIIARHKSLFNAFVNNTGDDGNGFINFNQFRSSLEDLGIDVRRADALQAFSIVDENEEQEISLEEYVHAVHIAMPTYDLLWKMLSKGKYVHATANDDDEYMSIAEIKVILVDKHTDWRQKSKCLRHAVLQIADPKRKGWESGRMMKELVPVLVTTLRSNNQMIVRDTCLTIAIITKSKKQHVKNVIAQLLKTCWELLDKNLPLITFSARFCLRLMIKYVPDDNNNKYLQTLLQGTTLKEFEAVRNSCYECILILIRKASNEQNNDFWKCIRDCISRAIAVDEVNDDVKEWGYKCLAAFEKSNLKKAKRFIDSLDSRCQKEYRLRNRKSSNFSDVDDDVTADDENDNKSAETVSKPTRGSIILSRIYSERKEQLDEAFDAYDDMGEGWLSNTRCMQFLRNVMNIEYEEAMVIIKGLDSKSDGHITKPRLLKWVFLHSPEMNPNPLLQKDAKIYGWTVSRVVKLEMRKDLYQQLLSIEKEDENEIGIFDIDTRLCVLKYLIQQKKKKNKK